MITHKLLFILSEGLIFGLLAIGVYVAFQWLRFPDLTPDGSFAVGAVVYVKMALSGTTPWLAVGIACLAGVVAGLTTALVNRVAKIPTVVAGLLVASALYSVNWLVLSKPNQFLDRSFTLVGDVPDRTGLLHLLMWLLAICAVAIATLSTFSQTFWGLRIRAIGENSLLARDFGTNETVYTLLGLGIANAFVSLSGALFAQRSFSADINMGIGMTITGMAGMVLGLILSGSQRKVPVLLGCICVGSVLYKAVTFLVLELGMPAESFRLVSAAVLLIMFLLVHHTPARFLRGLKWS